MFPCHKLYSKYEKNMWNDLFFLIEFIRTIFTNENFVYSLLMWNNVFAEGWLSESLIYSEVKAIRKWWNRYIEHKKFTVPSNSEQGNEYFLHFYSAFELILFFVWIFLNDLYKLPSCLTEINVLEKS